MADMDEHLDRSISTDISESRSTNSSGESEEGKESFVLTFLAKQQNTGCFQAIPSLNSIYSANFAGPLKIICMPRLLEKGLSFTFYGRPYSY